MEKVSLAVVGNGLIGKSHISRILELDHLSLCAIVNPGKSGAVLASELGVNHYSGLEELFAAESVDGVVIATPNNLHADQARLCIDANTATLIEKPLTQSLFEAKSLLEYYESARHQPPMLVGHHRTYSSFIRRAGEVIRAGKIGQLTFVNGSALFHKPADYFQTGVWRTLKGGGPILINLIHEVGIMRYLVGEIQEVFAFSSSSARGFEVEDSCTIALKFENGALGSFALSDVSASTRSWEQTTGENPSFWRDKQEACYHISGTRGSLSLPTMKLQSFPSDELCSWLNPMNTSFENLEVCDPLTEQLTSFAEVIKGRMDPKVSLYDGLANLKVVEAIATSAKRNKPIKIADLERSIS